MTLIIGARDGIYAGPATDLASVVEGYDVRRVTSDGDGGYLAATDEGLLASQEPTADWRRIEGSPGDLWAVMATPGGDVVVGSHDPADLFRSTDGGETWRRNEQFSGLPDHDDWDNLAGEGRVRDVVTHPDAPHRLVVGVEAEGVYVSEDEGNSWTRRTRGLNDDVHHLLVRGPEEYVAACGRGWYRTLDAGRTWTALDTHQAQFWYTYYRGSVDADGVLYTCGQDRAEERFEDPGASRIFRSADEGRTIEVESFPGCERDLVNAWTVADGRPVAGTVAGRLLLRESGTWTAIGRLPTSVRSLATTGGP